MQYDEYLHYTKKKGGSHAVICRSNNIWLFAVIMIIALFESIRGEDKMRSMSVHSFQLTSRKEILMYLIYA